MNYLICPAALTPSTFCEPSVLPFVIPLFLLRCLQSSLLFLTSCQLLSSRAKGFPWWWMSFPQVTRIPVGQSSNLCLCEEQTRVFVSLKQWLTEFQTVSLMVAAVSVPNRERMIIVTHKGIEPLQ